MSKRLLVIAVLSLCVFVSSTFGQKNSKKPGDRSATKQRLTSATEAPARKKVALDKHQQDAAMAFARENHPELVPLINQLRKSRRSDYQRALRELHSASTRFGRLKERLSPERYEQQLTMWKLDSRIRLQLAKWSVSQDSGVEADIKKSLAERQAIQREQYKNDLVRLEKQQKRLKSLLGKLNAEGLVAEWERLSKSVARRNKAKAKKAEETKPKKKKSESSQDGASDGR